MNPRERAVAALELRQPDIVPHFELEMQLTEEYFGERFSSKEDWDSSPASRSRFLRRDAELLLRIADEFSYCIVFYSGIHRPRLEDYLEGVRILRELDAGRHLLMCHGDTTLAIPDGEQYMRFSIDLFERADGLKEDQERALAEGLERGRKLREAGIDGFILCSDYCFNSGPFMSPAMFAEFVTPYLTRLTAGYRGMGGYVIKHTDGNIMPILDQLAASGPHGLHSLDPMAGVDIAEIKKRIGGRLCLVGNVDCSLMQTGTTEQILESCRYAMENARPGGGYIFSTSNVIFKGMPKASYDLMMEYYRSHNRYEPDGGLRR